LEYRKKNSDEESIPQILITSSLRTTSLIIPCWAILAVFWRTRWKTM